METGWTIAGAITRLAPADLLKREHAAREAQLHTISTRQIRLSLFAKTTRRRKPFVFAKNERRER